MTTQLPIPPTLAQGRDRYPHQIGPIGYSFGLGQTFTYTDNAGYSASGSSQSDFGLSTTANFGLLYRVSQVQTLQVDFGIGYNYWLNGDRGDPFQFSIVPNSHLHYQMGLGAVTVMFANNSATRSQASFRSEFSGGSASSPIDFNQLFNATSVNLSWPAARRMTVGGGYSFEITRTLNDQFGSLDQDAHAVSASVNYQLTAPLNVGLGSSYRIFKHVERVQNDGSFYSVGPTLQWRIRAGLLLSLNAGYSASMFDQTGTIQDTSEFGGINYSASVSHELNRRISHVATVSRSVNTGFGSNFTDQFGVTYSVSGRVGAKLNPSIGFSYRDAGQSGSQGENADLYSVNFGIGYPVLSRLSVSFGYAWERRVGASELTSFTENRLTLSAFYSF